MSIRPTDLKEPVYEAEPDLAESEIKKKELKINYILLITFLSLDLVITIIIMTILIHKNKMVKKAYEASEYLKKGSVDINNRKNLINGMSK